MLCENCHQNEASIHYTEIINGVKKEHHICMDCARRLNFAGMSDSSDAEFPFVRLLTGLLAGNSAQVEDGPMMHIRCPGCGMTFDEFTMVGKFGCAECYGVFGPLIEDNMKRLHEIQFIGERYIRNTQGCLMKIMRQILCQSCRMKMMIMKAVSGNCG